MELKYNMGGAERKKLVQAVSEFTGVNAVYMRTPTYAYQIGSFTITREGNLAFCDMDDQEEIENLIDFLAQQGFLAESNEYYQPMLDIEVEEPLEDCPPPYGKPEAEPTGLTISVPLEKVKVGKLTNILESKADLIKKALGVSDIRITVDPDKVSFPWFDELPDADTTAAYSTFICKLCEMSVNQARISAKAKDVENEKYAFRCFLLRLGFIGEEYKVARKILLRNLVGSSAFKGGTPKEATVCE